jgi:hypothetical protein
VSYEYGAPPQCSSGVIDENLCQGELAVPVGATCIDDNTTVPGFPTGYTWRMGSTDYVGWFYDGHDIVTALVPILITYRNGPEPDSYNQFTLTNWWTPIPDGVFDVPKICGSQVPDGFFSLESPSTRVRRDLARRNKIQIR